MDFSSGNPKGAGSSPRKVDPYPAVSLWTRQVSFAQTGVCRPLGEKEDLLVCALNVFID